MLYVLLYIEFSAGTGLRGSFRGKVNMVPTTCFRVNDFEANLS